MHFSHTPQGPASKASLGGPFKVAVVAALHLAVASVLIHQMNTRTFTMPRVIDDLTVDFRDRTEPPPPPPDPVEPEVRQKAPPQLVAPIIDIPIQPTDTPPLRAVHPQDAAPPVPMTSGGGTGTAEVKAAPLAPPAMRSAVLADAKSCATPDYPARAARNGDTGTVTLALLVGANGSVLSSRILSSSGSRELDRAAQSALSLCTFQPAMENGRPQEGWARIAYVWTLD